MTAPRPTSEHQPGRPAVGPCDQTAEALDAESLHHFRTVAENATDMIGLHSPDGTFLWASPSFRRLGYDPAELVGTSPYELFHPDDLAAVSASHEGILEQPDIQTVQYRIRCKDGSWLWVEATSHAIRDESGAVVELQASTRDISARREAEERLAESERQFRMLAESTSDVISRSAPDGAFIYISPSICQFGYGQSELLGASVFELIHPDDVENVRAQRAAWAASDESGPLILTWRLRRSDGEYRWVESRIQPVRAADGGLIENHTTTRDVTERIEAEERLARSERDFRTLAESTTDVISRSAPDGTVRYITPSIRQFGYEPEAMLGRSLFDTIHPEDVESVRAQRADWIAAGQQGPLTLLFRIRRTDGAYRWVEVKVQPLLDAHGELVENHAATRDVTDRVETSQRLAAEERRFRLLSENAPIGVYMSDESGELVFANDEWRDIYPLEDPNRWTEIVEPADLSRVEDLWLSAIAARRRYEASFRVRSGDGGGERWIEEQGEPYFNDAGEFAGIIGTVQDVTERRLAEQALAESERQFRILAEQTTDFISRHAPDGTYLYVSPSFRALGYEPQDLLGRNAYAFFHPDDAPDPTAMPRGESPPEFTELQFRFLCADGSYRWLESHGRLLFDAETRAPTELHVSSRDVTARVEAQRELARKTELFEGVLEGATAYSIIATDRDGIITVFNGGAERMLGYSAEELVGRRTPALLHLPEEVAARAAELGIEPGFDVFVRHARLTGEAETRQWTYVKKNGAQITVVLTVTALHDEAKGLIGYLGVAQDVTEKLRLESERDRMFTLSRDLLCIIEAGSLRIVRANPAWLSALGWGDFDLQGMHFSELLHPEDLEPTRAEAERLASGGAASSFETRLRSHDGGFRWISWNASAAKDGATIYAIGRDITEEKRRSLERAATLAELQRLSETDALTGAFNRRHLTLTIDAALADPERCGRLGMLMLDVDRFKAINDTYGHTAGDVVLQSVAGRLRNTFRQGACVARWGGEEFCILLEECLDDEVLRFAAERARSIVSDAPIALHDGSTIEVTISVGATRVGTEEQARTIQWLEHEADGALYTAKRRGRNRAVLASEAGEELLLEDTESLQIARALALATSTREGVPELHCEQVARHAAAVAHQLGLPARTVHAAGLGGWVHDVGKVAIADEILAKRSALDEDEWARMRRHAEIGETILRNIPLLTDAIPAVRHHHERWDGQGYPDGLAGEEIPIIARIVACADAYSTITSERTYKRGSEQEEAVGELRRSAGSHLDPDVVEALVQVLRREHDELARRFDAIASDGDAA